MMFSVANAVDDLRQLVAKADALAHATENLFEQVIWVEDGDDRRRLERLAHLVGATAEAVQAAVEAGDELAVELANHKLEA
jgi:ABC-type transporter Mla subunit MlaD